MIAQVYTVVKVSMVVQVSVVVQVSGVVQVSMVDYVPMVVRHRRSNLHGHSTRLFVSMVVRVMA